MPLNMSDLGKSRVILGLMTFGPDESGGARITSLADYNKCLDYFQSQGYSEVDTARVYVGGKQEAFTNEANWKDRGLSVATKCYPKEPGMHKPGPLRESLETSLKELGSDCVDIFYLHAADRSVPFAETLEVVNQMHKEGKFVRLGLSNFTAFEVAEVVITCKERGWVRPSIYQGMYNAISALPALWRALVFALIPHSPIIGAGTHSLLPSLWYGRSHIQSFGRRSVFRQDQVRRCSCRRSLQRYRSFRTDVQSTVLQRRHVRCSSPN